MALQRTEVDNTIIRAPFSGVASENAQPGEMVSPVSAGGGFTRTGICTIVDMSSLEVEVDVNESYINRVKPGQSVQATLDAYPEWRMPAKVIAIIPTADRQKATVKVRVGFDKLDPRILPEMSVKVAFLREDDGQPGPAQPVALVPQSALVRVDGQTFVFVVTGSTVDRRAVSTGGIDGTRIEVVAGLRAGERIVVRRRRTLPRARSSNPGVLTRRGHQPCPTRPPTRSSVWPTSTSTSSAAASASRCCRG